MEFQTVIFFLAMIEETRDLGSATIDVGLIGLWFCRTHLPCSGDPRGQRPALAAILQRKGTEAASAYPDVRIARNVEEMFASDSIQLVVIATPQRFSLRFGAAVLAGWTPRGHRQAICQHLRRGCGTGFLGGKVRAAAFGLSKSPLRWRLQRPCAICSLQRLSAASCCCESHYDRYRLQLRPGRGANKRAGKWRVLRSRTALG